MKNIGLFTLSITLCLYSFVAVTTTNVLSINAPKPADWHSQTNLDIEGNLKKTGFEKDKIEALLKNHKGSLPVAVYMKYLPQDHAGIIPTIQINLRKNPTQNMMQFKQVMEMSVGQMSKYLNGYQLTTELKQVTIDSLPAIHFMSTFKLGSPQGDTTEVRSWAYNVPVGDYFYQINLSDIEGERCDSIYKEFIEGIAFGE